MFLSEAINKIVSDVTQELLKDFQPSIYVGKTDDVVRRANEHQQKGLPCTFRIAHGDPKVISELETQLITDLRKVKNCTVLNKVDSSIGNPEAEWLYLSLSECHPDDELCEYEERQLLGEEYPLEIE